MVRMRAHCFNLDRRENGKEVCKEKFSKESLNQDESRTKEVVKEVAFEEKTMSTMDVMSMIGKKLSKKTIKGRK